MAGYFIGLASGEHYCWCQSMSHVLTGLKAWVLQRASAVYLLLFVVLMPIAIIFEKPDSVNTWQSFIYSPVVAVMWIMFFASLFVHAWVGMRDVVIDYVHPLTIRVLLLSLLALYLIVLMIWVLRILLLSTGAVV